MIATGERPNDELREVTVVLSVAQLAWLDRAAAEHEPPIAPATVLGRLVDRAIARGRETTLHRAHQLEIYGASGYPEHHPDYPNIRKTLRSV